jgi:hypothetical protein
MKKALGIPLIIGALFGAVELLDKDLVSAGVLGFIAIFLVLWIFDFFKEKVQEKSEKAELHAYLLLRKRLHVQKSVGPDLNTAELFNVIQGYIQRRFSRRAGFKVRGRGNRLPPVVRVRSTLISWLNIEMEEREIRDNSPRHVRVSIIRNTAYTFYALGVTIAFFVARIAEWAAQGSLNDLQGLALAVAVCGIVILAMVYGLAWLSAKRWFPEERLILLRDDLDALLAKAGPRSPANDHDESAYENRDHLRGRNKTPFRPQRAVRTPGRTHFLYPAPLASSVQPDSAKQILETRVRVQGVEQGLDLQDRD